MSEVSSFHTDNPVELINSSNILIGGTDGQWQNILLEIMAEGTENDPSQIHEVSSFHTGTGVNSTPGDSVLIGGTDGQWQNILLEIVSESTLGDTLISFDVFTNTLLDSTAGILLSNGEIYIPTPENGTWTPSNQLLGTAIELSTNFQSPTISVDIPDINQSSIRYTHVAGQIPQSLELIDNMDGTAKIVGDIIDMDEYVPGWQEPPGFTYDTLDRSGGKYATYGSAQAYSKTFTFVIRATGDSPDSNTQGYSDRLFSITILNNYSSDRDRFIRKYYKNKTLEYLDSEGNVKLLTPDEYIIQQKNDGYFD